VVYLKDIAFAARCADPKAELHRTHETFVPHVLAVTRGSSIDFPNDDPIYHNVSRSRARERSTGRYPQGRVARHARSKTGDRQGLLPDPLAHERDDHGVRPSVLHDPALDRHFELPNVPPGDYTLVGWHERVGERTRACTSNAARPRHVVLDCRSRTRSDGQQATGRPPVSRTLAVTFLTCDVCVVVRRRDSDGAQPGHRRRSTRNLESSQRLFAALEDAAAARAAWRRRRRSPTARR
jgi:hypothetical protein